MGATETITAAIFQARCLEFLNRVEAGDLSRVEVTQRGRVVAVMTPVPASATVAKGLHGALRGRVLVPPGVDLTAPALDHK